MDAANLRKEFLTKNDDGGASSVQILDERFQRYRNVTPLQRPRSSSLTSVKSNIPKPHNSQNTSSTAFTRSSEAISQPTARKNTTPSRRTPMYRSPLPAANAKRLPADEQRAPLTPMYASPPRPSVMRPFVEEPRLPLR